jgi:DNA-binding NarL/FixJ family response regulator
MTDHGTDTCVLFKDVSATMSIGLPRTCCLQQAFMAGARGAVRKTSTREELMRVIRAVHAGQIAVEEPSLSLLLSRIFGRSQASASQPHLTQREQEVIRALALGKANKEIAVMLGIREQTVKNHISHILEKLGLEDRLQIVVFAARHHLISLESV